MTRFPPGRELEAARVDDTGRLGTSPAMADKRKPLILTLDPLELTEAEVAEPEPARLAAAPPTPAAAAPPAPPAAAPPYIHHGGL